MAVYVAGERPAAWQSQVKAFVKKRYAHLAEADAFPEGGAQRARAAGYPLSFLDALPVRVASSYCGCGCLLEEGDLDGVRLGVELGCGAGLDALLACEKMEAGARLLAVDFTKQMLLRAEEALANVRERGVRLLAGDMEGLPLADEVADLVLANASFNLVVDKERAIAEAFRILRPGGRLLLRELVRVGALPAEVAQDPQAWNASLGGVCEQGEWKTLLSEAGFIKPEISGHTPFRPVVSVRIQARKPGRGGVR